MADRKVLIVGTMAFDEVETPTGSSGKIIAGSATYTALATSFFDVESAIVSIVGRDFPQDYLKELSKRNINLDGVEIDNSGDTFYWKGRYHKNLVEKIVFCLRELPNQSLVSITEVLRD